MSRFGRWSVATAWLALSIREIGRPKLDRGALRVPVETTSAPKAPESLRLRA